MNQRCLCAMNLDMLRTNTNIIRDIIKLLQRTQTPLHPADINDRIYAITENIRDIIEDCQIKDKESLEYLVDAYNRFKELTPTEAVTIPLDELRLRINNAEEKVTRAMMKCAKLI